MGGFITSAARLMRTNVRPLLLPAPGQSPSLVKRLYDLGGTVLSAAILNYAASPFMLLTAESSFIAWTRLGFYGHIIIGGTLVFFYSGGTGFFRGLQKKRGLLVNGKPVNGTPNITPGGSPVGTPTSEKTFMLPPGIDQVVPPKK